MSAAEPQFSQAFTLRQAVAGDLSYIQDSWKRSYRHGSAAVQRVPGPIYYTEQAALIARILTRAIVVVACATDAPEQILGWACVERAPSSKPVLHYLNVKQPFRGFGIARALLSSAGFTARGGGWCTHLTDQHGEKLARALGLIFNPYLLGVVP